MKLDVKMETRIVTAVGRRLMQRHHVREGHLPKVIELHQHLLQQRREVAEFVAAECGDARMRRFGSNKDFIRVTCEVGNESNRRFVLADYTTTVFLLGANHILEEYATRFCMMMLTRTCFSLNRLEDEVGGVDLTMRVLIRNADCFPFVFKDQHVVDLFASTKLSILILPHFQQVFDRARLEFSKCEAVIRDVANYARDSGRRLIAINAGGWWQCLRRVKTDARMIIVEDECG